VPLAEQVKNKKEKEEGIAQAEEVYVENDKAEVF